MIELCSGSYLTLSQIAKTSFLTAAEFLAFFSKPVYRSFRHHSEGLLLNLLSARIVFKIILITVWNCIFLLLCSWRIFGRFFSRLLEVLWSGIFWFFFVLYIARTTQNDLGIEIYPVTKYIFRDPIWLFEWGSKNEKILILGYNSRVTSHWLSPICFGIFFSWLKEPTSQLIVLCCSIEAFEISF